MTEKERPTWKQILWAPVYDAVERWFGRRGIIALALFIFLGVVGLAVWTNWPFGSTANREAREPSTLVEGVLPLHLWKKGHPITGSEAHFIEHRLGLIVKVKNHSDLGVVADVALMEGCVGISAIAAEMMLPPSEQLPSGTPVDPFTRHKHTIQRIRVSGFIRPDSRHIPARSFGYVGILFPFPSGRTGALLGVPGSISLKGNCEEIQNPSAQPSVLQIFKIERPIHFRRPDDLAEEIRDGSVRLSLSIGGASILVDPLVIKKLVSMPWESWQDLALPQMYEVPDTFYPPTTDDG